MKKIGILGGTFNPIHHGHLILGQTALEDFGLDKVLIVPTKNPAYKKISKNVEIEDRVNMVRMAIENHPGFEFSDIELDREGYTYTVDTLRKLTRLHPDAEYYFIMGADSLYQIESWKDPGQILSMATIWLHPEMIPGVHWMHRLNTFRTSIRDVFIIWTVQIWKSHRMRSERGRPEDRASAILYRKKSDFI